MERHNVESSSIQAVGYDPTTGMMEVEFKNGGVYRVHDVDTAAHQALMGAPSIGAHFNQRFKMGGFKIEKLS
jgi:hypothetical protein